MPQCWYRPAQRYVVWNTAKMKLVPSWDAHEGGMFRYSRRPECCPVEPTRNLTLPFGWWEYCASISVAISGVTSETFAWSVKNDHYSVAENTNKAARLLLVIRSLATNFQLKNDRFSIGVNRHNRKGAKRALFGGASRPNQLHFRKILNTYCAENTSSTCTD